MKMVNKKLFNVEALRAVAAVLVVFYHVDKYYYSNPLLWENKFLGGLFSFGHSGVEFFFVISGFIITMMHFDDGGKSSTIPTFIKKRFVRIYPFYWLVLISTIISMLIVPGVMSRLSISAFMGSIILAGIDPLTSVVFVSWTLFHEILFYSIFCIFLWKRRLGMAILVAWALVGFVASIFARPFYVLSPMHILFLFGIACSILLSRYRISGSIWISAAGVLLFLATGLDEVFWHQLHRLPQIVGYGLGSSLLLMGLVELERRERFKAGRLVVLVGQASYAIYLTHMLTLTALTKVVAYMRVSEYVPGSIAFIVLATTAVVVGVIMHLVIERPLTNWVRLKMTPSPALAPAT